MTDGCKWYGGRWIHSFVTESNRIEGINREPLSSEIEAHLVLINREILYVEHIEEFVMRVQPGAAIRSKRGMDVMVGTHFPPGGGPDIPYHLGLILIDANKNSKSPYRIHNEYETIHPFTDGNGRSGRAIWLWQMLRSQDSRDHAQAINLGFLHTWYYQSLQGDR